MYKHDGNIIIVSNRDTWTIPFMIKGHVLTETEKIILTVRKVNTYYERHIARTELGEILFQQALTREDLGIADLKNTDNKAVGFYACFVASKEASAKIPVGDQMYDLAVVDETKKTEWAYIPPTVFRVLEVLR